jgi:hypothetical protein
MSGKKANCKARSPREGYDLKTAIMATLTQSKNIGWFLQKEKESEFRRAKCKPERKKKLQKWIASIGCKAEWSR